MFYGTDNSKSENDNYNSEANLKNKLNNAFNDLDSLKKELRNIRGNNEIIIPHLNYKGTRNHSDKHDFFSDERYQHVINQIKESNTEKSRMFRPSLNSKEKFASSSIERINQNTLNNNFFGIIAKK